MRRAGCLWVAATMALGCAPAPPPAPTTSSEALAPATTTAPPGERVALHLPADVPDVESADPLRARIEAALENVRQRDLLTTHGFWAVFHGILGFGPGLTLLHESSGQRVNALEYILSGDFPLGEVRGLRFIPTQYGLDVQMGPTFVGQGHQDQFVAEIAQWGVPADQPVMVYGKNYTLMDFVRHSMANARVGQELSWTIILVAQFVSPDAKWTNRHGEELHLNDLIRSELDASIDQAACGGTHRLFGLTWCYHLHLRAGGKEEGVWKEVAEKIEAHKKLAKEYQNEDGSFSTNYFRNKAWDPDIQARIGSTGHTLEWLASAMSEEELREPWVQNAANALALMFMEIRNQAIESGALYHAAHGLNMYHHRLYGEPAKPAAIEPAQAQADKAATK